MLDSKKKLLCIFSFVFILLIVSGCNSNQQPNQENPPTDVGLNQLLENVNQNNTFVFEGIPWLISKEEVIQQKQLNDIQIKEDDRIVVEGKLLLDTSIKQHVIYTFEQDQLVSGEYLFQTNEKDQLDELGKKVKEILAESFPVPLTNNLDILDPSASSAENNEQIMWKGTDESYVRVSVLANDTSDYTLIIQISSPHPGKNSLQ